MRPVSILSMSFINAKRPSPDNSFAYPKPTAISRWVSQFRSAIPAPQEGVEVS